MPTNTNIKYTPYEGKTYKIELVAERINTLLKVLDATGGDKTLEELKAIIETIKDWDDSDDSLGVKEQLINIYNSMLSEDEFNKLYLPEIDKDIANVGGRVDTAVADEKSERQIEDTKIRTDLGAVKVQIGELETRTANNESGVAEAKGRLGAVESVYDDLVAEVDELKDSKTDKTTISIYDPTVIEVDFSIIYNTEVRAKELSAISLIFGNGEYVEDYISGLSFNSGEAPTAIDYTDSGILNWVGTDCATYNGLSIFQPSSNTHYDIVFYFNGSQFIGLVNGFMPATGNEAI